MKERANKFSGFTDAVYGRLAMMNHGLWFVLVVAPSER